MEPHPADTPAYRRSVNEALIALDSGARQGLGRDEARARLARFGPNELAAEKPAPAWRKFLAQFQDVLVLLLLAAAAISAALWAVERESALPYEALAILAIVILNDVLGHVQASRAETAVAALRRMAAGTLLVLDAGLPGGLIEGSGALRHAQTMAFMTLVMFQLFNVFNARSDDRSAFRGLFRNRWLWAAIGLSLALQAAVVHAPFLQNAFSTLSLGTGDWLLCAAVASSVLWLRELGKLVTRAMGTPG